jgi:phage anti-repressor protein
MTASQLVPVVPGAIGNTQCLTIDGRTLHGVLGVRRDFSNWIKARISKYGFVQGQDFEVFAKTGENSEGGRPSQEYRCTLGMGKELCMVENNEKGRVARRYFIECERRLLSSLSIQTSQDGLLSPAERAELKALVDAKLSTYPAAVQGKARAEIWTRFNRHFKIAEYAQLPAGKMSDARDYLIQMEVKALGAAAQPTATAAIPALVSDDAEGHLAAIRQHVRHIYDHEAALYGIVRHNLPSLWDIQGRERRIALRALDSMERASGALESILVCLESSTRTALAAGRA